MRINFYEALNQDFFFYLEIIDQELSNIVKQINESEDPDGEGLFDKGEYLIGAGFVAVQRCMLDTYLMRKQNKDEMLDKGPILKQNITYARAIWTAANYWKHDAEWRDGSIKLGEPDENGLSPIIIDNPSGGLAKKNWEIIKNFGKFQRDYLCSNVLAEICPAQEMNFSYIRKNLIKWMKPIT